jgi:predicted ATPase
MWDRFKNYPSIIAIEQPELHLHPTLQAQLADVFANIAKMKLKNENQPTKSKVTPRLLVETHSEAIVNRIGQLVGLGKLSADDVQVILFEPDQEKGGTKVSTTTFDEEGCLMNWPYGFFIPELPV